MATLYRRDLSFTHQVALYLRGDKLDPTYISNVLGIEPTESQKNGENRVTSTNKNFQTKTGLWALVDKRNSIDLAVFVEQISAKLVSPSIAKLEGVDEAYVDIFVAKKSDEDGGGMYAFEISQQDIFALNRLGVSIRVTVAIVRE